MDKTRENITNEINGKYIVLCKRYFCRFCGNNCTNVDDAEAHFIMHHLEDRIERIIEHHDGVRKVLRRASTHLKNIEENN